MTALAVVIVAYQSAGDLPATLAAVQAQLRPGDELVVVDNASPDDSAAVARAAAPEARVISCPTNGGFGAGCHVGAAASSAPLLLFLNPDARLAPGSLEALRAAAAEYPKWGAWQALVLLPGGDRVNTSGGVMHWLGIGWSGQCDEPVGAVAPAPHDVDFASGAALTIRRAAWEASGGFDPAYFMYGEDLDLSLRLRLEGWGIGVVPQARVEHAYEFVKGDYKWEFLERNRWWTIIGVYPPRLLAATLPALLAFELGVMVLAAAGGWLPAKLRAQAKLLCSLRWALARRRRVQATRRISEADFAAHLGATLDSPYLGAAARLPLVPALQAAYWRAVRRVLGR